MPNLAESPADEAGRKALEQMYACLDGGQSFRLEAGAGAGKTYSLEKALSRLIDRRGTELIRQRQQVACITYTNVAKEEIISRFQAHPAIRAETVHGFCWSLLKDFQVNLRGFLGEQPFWSERFEPVGGIGARVIHYEMGIPRLSDEEVSIRHEDVLSLMVQALAFPKFRAVFTSRYPVLLIDEYQDTDEQFFGAISSWYLDRGEGPVIGLFGDHWQRIYGEGCVNRPGFRRHLQARFRQGTFCIRGLVRPCVRTPTRTVQDSAARAGQSHGASYVATVPRLVPRLPAES